MSRRPKPEWDDLSADVFGADAPEDEETPAGYFDDFDRGDDSAAPAEDDPRQHIEITTALAANVDEAITALRGDANLYARDGQIVFVTGASRAESDATVHVGPDGRERRALLEGTPVIRPMLAPTLAERMTKVANFSRRTKTGPRACLPSGSIVAAALARGEWPSLRPLVGVIEAPSMRPDGSVIDVPGYDPRTGYLYSPSRAFERVPEAPTQADAARALGELAEVWRDMPFATEAARYVPIAATMTIIGRPAILGAVPLFLCDANTPGTGKSLLNDAVSIIATGRTSPRGTFPTSPEEQEKVLAAQALRGAAVVGFDNVADTIGGPALDKALTAVDFVEFRLLGASEIRSVRWRAVVIASGNNLAVQRDTARRVVIARLDSPLERPEDRSGFTHPNLLDWVDSNRPRLVRAALTVLRGYAVADCPDVGVHPWGSFEDWSRVIASAIVFAGGANVLDARPNETAGDDGERGAIVALLSGWARLDASGRGLSAREAIALLYPVEREARRRRGEPVEPDGHDSTREALESLAPPRGGSGAPEVLRAGNVLRRLKGRVVGGLSLQGAEDRNGVAKWRVRGGPNG